MTKTETIKKLAEVTELVQKDVKMYATVIQHVTMGKVSGRWKVVPFSPKIGKVAETK